jgi:chromosome segregation ATPase
VPGLEEISSMWALAPADVVTVESSANLRELMTLFGCHSVITALDKAEVERLHKVEAEHRSLSQRYAALARSSQALVERHAMLSDSAQALASRLDRAEEAHSKALRNTDTLQQRLADADAWKAFACSTIDMLQAKLQEAHAEIANLRYKSSDRADNDKL